MRLINVYLCSNVRKRLTTDADDDSKVTSSDVKTSSASSEMSYANSTGSARRPSTRRKHSTPSVVASSHAAAVESRRPAGSADVDAHFGRTRSTSRGRQSSPFGEAAYESSRRAVDDVTPRGVTGIRTPTPVRRTTTPNQWSLPGSAAATSPRQTPSTGSALTTSKKLFRSSGNLTMSAVSSPPPRRHMSSFAGATAATNSLQNPVSARHQLEPSSDRKPVVISGRGSREPAADVASTYDGGGGRNKSMRSRIGIAPNLLLPSCYQPDTRRATSPRTRDRSASVDASAIASSTDIATAAAPAPTSPRDRHHPFPAQKRHSSPALQPYTPIDSYPEPPPEDTELNSHMEMLFEEYRKVERGLIFSDSPAESSCPTSGAADDHSSTAARRPHGTSSKSSVGHVSAAVDKRVGRTISSARAKSVGNLSTGSTTVNVSAQQQRRRDRTVCASPSSSSTSVSSAARVTGSGGRSSTTHQRGQSSPGVVRRSAAPPATTPASRNCAVSDGVRTAARPRHSQQTVNATAAAGCSTDVTGPAWVDLDRTKTGGGGRKTPVRRDNLRGSLQDESPEHRDIGASAVGAVHHSSAGVDTAMQPQRRASLPGYALTAGLRAVPKPAQQVRANGRGSAGGGVTERSRKSTETGADDGGSIRVSTARTQTIGDDRGMSVRRQRGDETTATAAVAEALKSSPRNIDCRSRPSTVGARSLIPRPVSCSGRRHAASPRPGDRDAPTTKPPLTGAWRSEEPQLRRFDSGVDVATVGLSPSDDSVDGSGLEMAIERLSASLESCKLALLADS